MYDYIKKKKKPHEKKNKMLVYVTIYTLSTLVPISSMTKVY